MSSNINNEKNETTTENAKPVKNKKNKNKNKNKNKQTEPKGYYAEVFVVGPDPEEVIEEAVDKEEKERKRTEFRQYLTEEVSCLFHDFDIRGNGFLTLEDIRIAYKDFEINVDQGDCEAILKAFDAKGYGHIRLNDFHREMYDTMCNGTNEEHLKMVFQAMDDNNDGIIGMEELVKQFQKLGALVKPEEAREAAIRIDKISQGFIDFKQFKIFCHEIDKINTFEQNSKFYGK